MQFFVDTADVEAIQAVSATGLLDGVTTNPSLINKSGRNFKDVIAEICAIVAGPVSAEVTSSNYDEMITQGEYLANIASNVVVKLPLTMAGLKACAHFKQKGINTNVTLCFSPNQALLAAKAGATYVSPFVGRLDDINLDGMALIRNIRTIYANYDFATKILAASIRTPNHVTEAALAGADIATMPPDVIKKLSEHPLTTTGLAQFEADWKKTGQSFG